MWISSLTHPVCVTSMHWSCRTKSRRPVVGRGLATPTVDTLIGLTSTLRTSPPYIGSVTVLAAWRRLAAGPSTVLTSAASSWPTSQCSVVCCVSFGVKQPLLCSETSKPVHKVLFVALALSWLFEQSVTHLGPTFSKLLRKILGRFLILHYLKRKSSENI